jgi:putative endonuclease
VSESSYDPHRLGRHGEDLVARWYVERDYVVLARNWRCDLGEIDLVVARGGALVVCEVKTRSSMRFGHPAEAVGPDKQRRLRRLTACWLEASSMRPAEVRIDVAAVVNNRVEVIENAC